MGISFFYQATKSRTRGSVFKVCQRRFRWDIRKKFFIERVMKHWNWLHKEAAEEPSLEVFKICVDVELSSMVL